MIEMVDSPIEITNFQSETITHDNNNLVIESTRNIAFAAESMNGEERIKEEEEISKRELLHEGSRYHIMSKV